MILIVEMPNSHRVEHIRAILRDIRTGFESGRVEGHEWKFEYEADRIVHVHIDNSSMHFDGEEISLKEAVELLEEKEDKIDELEEELAKFRGEEGDRESVKEAFDRMRGSHIDALERFLEELQELGLVQGEE